jgi:histidine triad (HIT) family protein
MASGEMPVDKLHDDDHLFAIRDINPRAPVHFMVIPKEHIPTLAELTDGQAPLLYRMVAVAREIAAEEGIAERGYRVVINCGREGGQAVFHLHMHVLGGRTLRAEG